MAAFERLFVHDNNEGEIENIRRNRLPRVLNRFNNIQDLSDDRLQKRYRFCRESLEYITASIEDIAVLPSQLSLVSAIT